MKHLLYLSLYINSKRFLSKQTAEPLFLQTSLVSEVIFKPPGVQRVAKFVPSATGILTPAGWQ